VYLLFISSIVFITALSVSVALFSLLFTLLNYNFGIALEKVSEKKKLKDQLFWLFIFADIGILVFFKYFDSFFQGFTSLFSSQDIYTKVPYLTLMIPMGISYYTFQSLGYLIRIDRGSEKAEGNFATFATYLLFFPKFLSGPVERSNHFFPQLNKPATFDQHNIETGARLILWGLFKKIVIADNLYESVSEVYNNIHQYTGTALITILIIQTVYIYCDFSGYTDIALGIAKCFGINLINNFNRPFLAKNISEFWRRWHISLSSWCNDFIYNPFIVKYRRFGNTAVIMGIFLTFFIVGIWHGANFTFVILGLLQGIAIVYEFYTKRYRLKFASKFSKSTVNTLSRISVFIFMSFSMIFFFSNSVTDAWYFITHLFNNIQISDLDFINNKPGFIFALCLFIIIFIFEILDEKGKKLLSIFLNQHFVVRWAGYVICMMLIYFMYSGFQMFYYARF
jgi:D-alanyl-lipoteichoic acid acyltransferase DltB (MBOAT superfamily)